MRIGIPLTNLPLAKSGGIETYARNLIHYLQRLDRINHYLLYCTPSNEEAFPIEAQNFKKVIIGKSKLADSLQAKISSAVLKTFDLMEEVPYLRDIKNSARTAIKKVERGIAPGAESEATAQNDLLHFMFNTMPCWQDYEVPVVLTIVDVQHEYFPSFFSKDNLAERRRLYKLSADKADHIITISDFSKDSLVEKLNIPKEKITVIYLGYNEASFKRYDAQSVERIRRKYNLPASFLFYPAASWPHKNHINLISAYKLLKDEYGFTAKLVLTGIKERNYGKILKEIKDSGLTEDILHLGYISNEDLPLFYSAATVLVFPSLFEGFGLPVIEAMAIGLPTACSRSTSLPEIAGDAALFFDPERPEDIAKKIIMLYNDRKLMEDLKEKGLERAQLFSWERTARETLDVYEDIYRSYKAASL